MKRFLSAVFVTGLIGCALNPSESQSTPQTVTGSITSGGLTRTYRLHVPAITPSKAVSLVISLNGRGGTGQQLSGLTKFDALADKAGVVIVYPDGYEKSWADGRGGTPADKAGVDDVALISSLIDALSGQFKIDPTRVYAFGISNGGHMALRLACELPSRIVAVGVVAATMGEKLAQRCQPTAAVSVLLMHGTSDPLSPYNGGDEGGDRGVVLSAEAAVTKWASWNACKSKPTITPLPDMTNDGTRVNRWVYSACSSGSEVAFYQIEGGGHTWPSGPQYLPERIIGKVSRDLDASAVIWGFFSRFSRP
jgi:polyhydroxybutyrate depolymerase